VLFNEPKLLKCLFSELFPKAETSFSALQRAEIAEIDSAAPQRGQRYEFQCSSTSRNC